MKTMIPLLLLLASPVLAATESAAVRLSSGCSGVCISEDGLILTAEHCGSEKTIKVTFLDGQTATAQLVHAAPKNHTDEAQTYQIDSGGKYPFAVVSDKPAKAGEQVWTVGYPAGNYQKNRGKVRRVGFTATQIDGFDVRLSDGIVTDWNSDGGHSGGPLFNAAGEVVGLLSMSGESDSYWIGHKSIQAAIKGTQEPVAAYRRSDVIVFTTPGCGPCERLKADYRAGKFTGHTFRFVSYDQNLREWSDPELAREFARSADAPSGLGFPVIWVRGSKNFRVGYDPNQRSGLLGWITRVIDGLAKLIVGETPPVPFPAIDDEGVPVPVPDELPPTPVDATKAAVDRLRADMLKAKADVEKLKSSNPLTKLKGVVALKGDVAAVKASAEAALAEARGVKDDAKEKPLQYLWGLFGILSGLAHRRFTA